jgi:outer membrane protein
MAHGIHSAAALCLAAGLLACGAASAQSAGSLLGRVGATQIKPQVKSGDLTAPSFAGTQADIKSDTELSAGLTYMVTDNIAVDLPLSFGFKHDIVGTGAIAGVGKIGDVKALPMTLLAQYKFLDANAPLRPYLGVGPTYAKFYKARSTAALTALTGGTPSNPTTLTVDSKWALTAQVGATYVFSGRWYADATVLKTFLKTRTTLSTGQTLEAKLDPLSFCVSVGYRF